MPKTKLESIFFTAMTAFMMVFIMTVYNTALATHQFTHMTLMITLKSMWIEYLIIFLLAYFVSGSIAKSLVFKVVQNKEKAIVVILTIQIFTVILQVAFASIIGVYQGFGFTTNFIPHYLFTYCKNFILALPVQLIVVGPIARFIFRSVRDLL